MITTRGIENKGFEYGNNDPVLQTFQMYKLLNPDERERLMSMIIRHIKSQIEDRLNQLDYEEKNNKESSKEI